MTKDLRTLCDEAIQLWDADCDMEGVISEMRGVLGQPEPDASQLSDGYHTFAELYEHRHALCLALMRAMPRHCWFSFPHGDGERCFGGNDWFIVGAELPGASVTYHLPAELYPVAQATGAAELEKGRLWDGHTAADVVLRLREWAALAQPEPQWAQIECNAEKVHGDGCSALLELRARVEALEANAKPTPKDRQRSWLVERVQQWI